MNTYNVNWKGLDRGHESTWNHEQWRFVLDTFAAYSPVDINDVEGAFYQALSTKYPNVQWVTITPDGTPRTFFRDGREAWSTTGVVRFPKNSTIATITSLGKRVVEGQISYADVLSSTALLHEENGEHPFYILLDALKKVPAGQGLSIDDVIKIMHHYRPGDDIREVLSAPPEHISITALRRLKLILRFMTFSGLAFSRDNLFYAGQDASNYVKLTGDDLREPFVQWLIEENVDGSGKANSYLIALDDAGVIAQAYCEKFTIPSVYDMPDSTLESLRNFIAGESNKEKSHEGTGLFCSLDGLHGKSYWRDGYCSAAIRELLRFKSIFRDGKVTKDSSLTRLDLLTVALKLFADCRATEKTEGWNNYDEWTHALRTEFAAVDPSLLEDAAFDYLGYMRKYAISWQVANTKFSTHTVDEKRAVLTFLKEHRSAPRAMSWYLDGGNRISVGGVQVKGMSPKTVLYFMSELRPNEFAVWTEPTYDALIFLGLHKGNIPNELTIDTYEDCKAKQHQIVSRMKELGIGKASDDASDPDYHTVNEFIWWVNKESNQDLIKEKVMSKVMKPADYSTSGSQPQTKKPKVNLAKAEDVVLLRLAAALRTKPFAILAGHSGTGKSRMVRQLAYMTAATGNHKVLFEDADGKPLKSPGNFCMVQVKPNWHDSTDLLGYYSELKGGFKGTDFVKFLCKAYAYPDVPFFVCLDEMNLAPVEQYFAEYLSAIESRKLDAVVILDKDGAEKTVTSIITDKLLADEAWRTSAGVQDFSGLGCEFTQSEHWLKKYGLTIPRNLFVVGTVNMDESTNQFSRKVLDRAFTLEMTDADFENFGVKDPEPTFADFAGDDFAKVLLSGDVVAKKPADDASEAEKQSFAAQIKNLTDLKPVLDGTSFVVAYRFANEYLLYANALGKMREVIEVSGEAHDKKPEAFDDMILMKVLPRITGDAEMVMRIFAGDPGQDKEPKALDDADVGGLAKLLGKESASFEKMKEIVKRGESNGSGTLTFWP